MSRESTLKLGIVFSFFFTGTAWAKLPKVDYEVSEAELALHIFHESSGNDKAIGDKKLKDKAYGPLQIRKPVCDDVNRRYGTKIKASDCLGNRELSIWVARAYWSIYATKKRLGRQPTALDRAGIWNGGPNGHKRAATDEYRENFTAMGKCQKAGKPLRDWRKFQPKRKKK